MRVAAGAEGEFDALRAAYRPQFAFDALGRDERARFWFRSDNHVLGATRLAAIANAGWTYERSAQDCGRSRSDAVSIGLYLSGRHSGAAGAVAMDFGPGDIAVTQVDRPTRLRSSAFEAVRIIVERATIAPFAADLDRAHGLVLPAGSAPNAVLRAHLLALREQADRLTPVEAVALGRASAVLVAACIGPAAAARETVASAVETAKLAQVRRFVEGHLGDPALDADRIARACGLSRAALYRLTAPLGGVMCHLRERRLARAFAALSMGMADGARIGTIAAASGFADAAAFSRAFSARYGLAPRDLRGHVSAPALPPPDPRFAALTEWLAPAGR